MEQGTHSLAHERTDVRTGANGVAPRVRELTVTRALIRSRVLYAWAGPSLLITTVEGECGPDHPLTGYFFREARHLQTIQLRVNGQVPALCESAVESSRALSFNYIYPERVSFGGGGTDAANVEDTTDEFGVPHRSVDIRLRYEVDVVSLGVVAAVTNRSFRHIDLELSWAIDADFADLEEALSGERQQNAPVGTEQDDHALWMTYLHDDLHYRTRVSVSGRGVWSVEPGRVAARVTLSSQESAVVRLLIEPDDGADTITTEDANARNTLWQSWRAGLARIECPGERHIEEIVRQNMVDVASLPLLDGAPDEWLAPQAGLPLYPALFGRDALTAGWQAASIDGARMLGASLTTLGRRQSTRYDDWHDEQPGRLLHEFRRGPLARLERNPRGAYFGDYAGPLMFVIALAHWYAWTGDRKDLIRHWDVARRALDWARRDGDLDGDGYLEYLSRSSDGLHNQGWKDSGRAILYEDGTVVPTPSGTCELQGYWFAAQQLAAVLSWVLGESDTGRAWWTSANELKTRFNRDWWLDEEGFVALAMDPDKRLVNAPSSNVGHCVASGIISNEHLPCVVGRLFAPDMFSGWGIRTLSSTHPAYNPISYHLGSVWAVEQATIAFGLRRFGFEARALDLTRAMFDLARLYPAYRIPECVGGSARSEGPTPGAYPQANAPQLWNASSFALLIHTILGLQPVAPLEMLVIDPVLPTWLSEIVVHDLRLAGATATLRFWRDGRGQAHGEVLHKRGTFHLVRQPPLESLSATAGDRFRALADSVMHH